MRKFIWALATLVLIAGLGGGATAIQAQEETILTLALPQYVEEFFGNDIVTEFEAQNPGIQLYIVTSGSTLDAPVNANSDIETYLDDTAEYVSSADVVLVDSSSLLSEATRAGYFLDLAPLVNSDPEINVSDFYSAVWQAFQWNGGIWAVPVSADAAILQYLPSAFDSVGLGYPDASWTLADFDFALRTLTQYNADGTTAMPAMLPINSGLATLFISLLGDNVYDELTFPATPDLSNPYLETILDTWVSLQQDGVFDIPTQQDGLLLNEVPITLGSNFIRFGRGATDEEQQSGALLPGGRAGVSASGFAVSSGTRNPEAAYALVKFLSQNPSIANSILGSYPARRSLEGVESTNGNGGPGGGGPGGFVIGGNPANTNEALDALARQVLETGISASELLYASAIDDAINLMNQNGVDARTALDEVKADLIQRLEVADARRETVQITVALPPEAQTLDAGEVRISFGLASFVTPLPNQAIWDQLATEFAERDSEVGQVLLEVSLPRNSEELAETNDCFYQENNIVSTADLSTLLSIDPLLDTDPTFNANDLVAGVLSQLQMNNQTWGMPLTLSPGVLRYNTEMFQQAGAYPPNGTWSVAEFEDALRTLKAFYGDEPIPFAPAGFGGNTYLLNLIASYGGLPLDYRTDPVTVNFTDPATVEAIRQVLDLVKAGYIDYSALANQVGGGGGGGGVITIVSLAGETTPIYTEIGGGIGRIVRGGSGGQETQPDPMVTFPTGTQMNAVSFDIAAAYISAQTPHAEACYRFISYIADNATLFEDMPVRRSQINSFEVANSHGEEAVAFYQAMDNLMQQPSTITLPATQVGTGAGQQMMNTWLNRAFDRYVLEDADLEAELTEAQTYTIAYQECVAAIPEFDPATGQEGFGFFQQYMECATQIDPTISG